MIRRAILTVAAMALLVPAAAQADGVYFGFAGGTLQFIPGPAVTTGLLPTFTDITRIPTGVSAFGNLGTVTFTTGSLVGTAGNGDMYFGTGGSFVITVNQAFSDLVFNSSGGAIVIAPNTNVFTGSYGDITTSPFLAPLALPGSLATAPGGTGAIWSSVSCPPSVAGAGVTCTRLVGALTGTLDPGLLAWLGLSGSTGNGWVGDINFSSTGQVYNITFGDGQLQVPEPGTLMLFGTGLVAIAGVLRRKIVA